MSMCGVEYSVFGLVCHADALPDDCVDSAVVESLLATATGSTRRRTVLSDQQFLDVRSPLQTSFAVDISPTRLTRKSTLLT